MQVFRANLQVPPNHKIRPLLDSLEIKKDDWRDLFLLAKETGLAVSAFVYDKQSLEWAIEWDPDILKLNSSDLTHRPMLEEASKTGKIISLGTGSSTKQEIDTGLKVLSLNSNKIILMHGVQDFPTEIKDSRLNRIGFLRENWNYPVGYADHTSGDNILASYLDFVALGQGASVFEKHLCLNRKKRKLITKPHLNPKVGLNMRKI